jgi:hypothetical protein
VPQMGGNIPMGSIPPQMGQKPNIPPPKQQWI